MNKTVINNVHVITADKILYNSNVVIENGKITDIDVKTDWTGFDGQMIDGKGQYLSPGFIDIHCHGGGGCDFMDGTPQAFIKACETHAKYGTTTIVPTTLAGDNQELKIVFEAFLQAKKAETNGAYMAGLHLEGPYFSAEFKGAQDEKYIRNPKQSDYEQIYKWSQGSIIRWSAAPELPNSDKFGWFLKQHNIKGSIAHSAATYEDVLEAFDNGFEMITHLYSGMSTIIRKKGFRIPGVVESAYLIDNIKAELIADGCHLPPSLLKLAYKFKGADNLVLVTDSMRAAGMSDGEYILGSMTKGQKVIADNCVAYLPDYSAFAGSICTSDRLVRTMYKQANIPFFDVIKMITATPAKAIDIYKTKGSITVGKDADLLLFDEDISVTMTMIKGKIVYMERG